MSQRRPAALEESGYMQRPELDGPFGRGSFKKVLQNAGRQHDSTLVLPRQQRRMTDDTS